ISGNQIIWDNPNSKTVYAVFGDSQFYSLNLNYHLANSNIFPVYTDVAFPPDRLNQKIIVESIKPLPNFTYTDEDGNFMGRYFLKPRENLSIIFSANAEISAKPREEVLPVMRDLFGNQSKYLLTEERYWQNPQITLNDGSANSIYKYVVNTLQYDYKRVGSKNQRLGAIGAIKYPNSAVCVEFTDLFIGISRENGIYSREIEGYGFSKDPQLRPLSLISDVLHSWPEYYDKEKGLWLEVDPTWENTSGIDYFSSFDLNHIAFAVHGKRSDYPLPAGMYKTEDSRDISVTATTDKPSENSQIRVAADFIPSRMNDQQPVKTKITLINKGNVFQWNIPVRISSDNLEVINSLFTIPVLAPFEKKDLNVELLSKYKNRKIGTELVIAVAGKKEISRSIMIIPFVYEITLKISTFVALVIFFILLIKLYRTNRKHGH
ncbi:transglutaminase domain-containing protein, partial [Candidatus Roizmanbacteria bacterium]|nr:transglutaminase domain-containing protein [Candidatus Roizmanbacteria bacterium]